MKTIVIATKNKGKIRELEQSFANLPVRLVPLSDYGELPDAIEDGATFKENAIIKATYYMKQTGTACLADDSGLEVEILENAPGVYSARFAGLHATDEANNQKLIHELSLKGVSSSPAAYRCVLAFSDTDGPVLTAEGKCIGTIHLKAKGTGGFGYDPYFYISKTKTMAELTLEEKNRISHRGAAIQNMADLLSRYLAEKNESDSQKSE